MVKKRKSQDIFLGIGGFTALGIGIYFVFNDEIHSWFKKNEVGVVSGGSGDLSPEVLARSSLVSRIRSEQNVLKKINRPLSLSSLSKASGRSAGDIFRDEVKRGLQIISSPSFSSSKNNVLSVVRPVVDERLTSASDNKFIKMVDPITKKIDTVRNVMRAGLRPVNIKVAELGKGSYTPSASSHLASATKKVGTRKGSHFYGG